MSLFQAPRLEKRRASDFERELLERARAWVPSWGLDDERDFGRALLKVAARFSSEVAERLDRSGDKMRRGFLDWLGVRGEAARPARMPVVFKMAAKAVQPVLEEAPARLQVEVQNASVVFETESDVQVVPGRLEMVVATDGDQVFLPGPGLTDIEPVPPAPEDWLVKRFAPARATKLQLDPSSGLAADMIVEAGGQQYRIVQVGQDIVTVEPELTDGLVPPAIVRKVTSFAPFDGKARNRQAHALYLGDTDLLNIDAAATLEIVGGERVGRDVVWQYWGKHHPNEEVAWQDLVLAPEKEQQPDAIVLKKPKGAVEPREIVKGGSSRWIRAFKATVDALAPLLQIDSLQIRVNCNRGTVLCPPGAGATSPEAEALANTTPLVLDDVFFPLGKEPRQFDAFYLGSAEAFSKKGAKVQLCFELADPTFTALAAVRAGFTDTVLAGVAQDRALHLLAFDPSGNVGKFREPLRPPLPGFNGQAASSIPVALDRRPPWRLPVWSEGDDFLVATSAGGEIWIWHEKALDRENSGWITLGQLPPGASTAAAPVDGLVYLAGAPAKIAALRGNELFLRDWPNGTRWDAVDTLYGVNPVALKSIVPVLVDNGSGTLVTSATAGMVGVSSDKKPFHVFTTGNCVHVPVTVDLAVDVRPVAVDLGKLIVVAVADSGPPRLIAHRATAGQKPGPLDGSVVGSLEGVLAGGAFHVLAALGNGRLVSWAPFGTGTVATLLDSAIAPGVGQIGGTPTEFDGHLVIPGAHADVFVSDFDVSRRHIKRATVAIGIVVPDSVPTLHVNDLIVREVASLPEARLVTDAGLTQGGEVFYPIDKPFPAAASGPLFAYDLSATFTGVLTLPKKLALDILDHETAVGSWLLIVDQFFKVDSLTPTRVATISPAVMGTTPASGTYVRPFATGGRVAPFIRLDPGTNGNWDADLLARLPVVFPGAMPREQHGKAFKIALGNHPVVVVLGQEFSVPPPADPADFVIDAAVGDWQRHLGDTSTNPELSWEYWNGTGWWKLDVTLDETLNLKSTGALRFDVPTDIAPTDWSGRTNHWIRARLIGGDYGREKVTVKTSPTTPPGVTEQTIERSSEGIRPPSIVSLHISYGICQGVLPVFVLAEDSGSIRDQSDANRTTGAAVEAFVPLSVSLGRLLADGTQAAQQDECPPECSCPGQPAAVAPADASSDELNPPLPVTPATGRSLFLGFDAPLSGDTVNVLLMTASEHDHDALAPLAVEALIGNRFVPLAVKDDTRALGESGLLTLSFPEPPTRAELFGRSLRWLRLAPRATAVGWSPSLRGAYLNAVWASATETLTRELLGSSEGAPNLKLKVARPPVLRDSLVLRVKEPLGEEERSLLSRQDTERVRSDVRELPGDWVLWEQVVDPADEGPDSRVYSLDEASGEIRFGDGRHGAIPPVGRDSIVAFSYQRTEPPAAGAVDVPANDVAARTKINLVTPVAGVEAAFSADHAAGGAPAEPVERVLRFGSTKLRNRRRAVTAQDLEDLALQSSPDVVQAHALVRGRETRLVVVMRGDEPRPLQARKRELKRLLLSAAPPSVDPDALKIKDPKLRYLRVSVHLRVASLDHAGAVAKAVKGRLTALFDTATGGRAQEGWPLGASPREEDVTAALLDVPKLLGIAGLELSELRADGTQGPWPDALAPHELARLTADGVRFEFESMEVAA